MLCNGMVEDGGGWWIRTGEPVAAAARGDVNPFSGEPGQKAELTDAQSPKSRRRSQPSASAAASTTPPSKGKSAPRKDRVDHVVDGVFDDAAKRAKALIAKLRG